MMTPYELGYNRTMKTAGLEKDAGLWDAVKNTGRLLATGRSTLNHGTSREAARTIRAMGLVPQGMPGVSGLAGLDEAEKGLSFLSRSSTIAKNYARQAEGIQGVNKALESKDSVGSLLGDGKIRKVWDTLAPDTLRKDLDGKFRSLASDNQGRMESSRIVSQLPGRKGDVVEATIPWHKLRKMEAPQIEPHRDNLVLDDLDDAIEAMMGRRYNIKTLPYTDVFAARDGVPAKYIRGSSEHARPGVSEVVDHVRNIRKDPKGFAKEVVRQALGREHRPSTLAGMTPDPDALRIANLYA